MIRHITTLLIAMTLFVTSSKAALVGSFQQLATGITTNPSIYAGAFDTWAFEMQSNDLNYNALDLRFSSPAGNFLNTGGSTFRNSASNPLITGQQAPDTFFVLPPGTVIDVLTNDTANALSTTVVLGGAPTLVPNTGAKTVVAFFSVPQGTILNSSNFVFGQASSSGSPAQNVTYGELVPEPMSAALAALAIAFGCCFRNRRA